MKLVDNLAHEFEGLCETYIRDPRGKDIVTLVRRYMDENEEFDYEPEDFQATWGQLLYESRNQITVQMVGVMLYLLVTYWARGQDFYKALPELEKMLLRDTFFEMQDEIERRSAANGNLFEPVPGS